MDRLLTFYTFSLVYHKGWVSLSYFTVLATVFIQQFHSGKLIFFFASFYFLIFLALFLSSIATEFASLEVLKLEKQIAEKQVNLYC